MCAWVKLVDQWAPCLCFCSDLDIPLGSCWVSLWKSFLLEWSASLQLNHLFFCLWGIRLVASVLGAKRVKGTVGSCHPKCRLIESHFSHVSHASSQLCPLPGWSLIHPFLPGLGRDSGLGAQVQEGMWGVSLLLAQISAHLHPCSAQRESISVSKVLWCSWLASRSLPFLWARFWLYLLC